MRRFSPPVEDVREFYPGEPSADSADDPKRADGSTELRVARGAFGDDAGGVGRIQTRFIFHQHANRFFLASLRGVV